MSDFLSIVLVLIYVIGFPYLVRFLGKQILKVLRKFRGAINDLQTRLKRGVPTNTENS